MKNLEFHERKHERKVTKVQCPKYARGDCQYDDCNHHAWHWRGTHCSKDIHDTCPTCLPIPDKTIRIIKGRNA